MMKTTRHSLMAKGILVLLSLLILIFVFTYSWFMDPNTPAVASGLSLTTSADVGFDVAVGFYSPDTGTYLVTDFTDDATNASLNFSHLVIPQTIEVQTNENDPNEVETIRNEIGTGEPSKVYSLFSEFVPVDLTGNGTSLYRPPMLPKNAGIDTSKAIYLSNYDITRNIEYISFDIIVRSTSSGFKVNLKDSSYAVSAAEVFENVDSDALDAAVAARTERITASDIDAEKLNGGSAGTDPIPRLSTYGNFSEDSVVGAVRLAFTPFNNTNNLITVSNLFNDTDTGENQIPAANLNVSPSLLWIPRSDIYLQSKYYTVNAVTKEDTEGWVLYDSKDGSSVWENGDSSHAAIVDGVNTGASYKTLASQHTFYDPSKFGGGTDLSVSAESRYTTITTGQENSILATDLSENDNVIIESICKIGGYYYGKCRVNMWIEGCDAEARRAIDGGKFFFGLELESIG